MTFATNPPTAQTGPRPGMLWLVLLVIGLAWGATGPFSKLAVSTGNHPIGVTFWNTAIGAVLLTATLFASGRRRVDHVELPGQDFVKVLVRRIVNGG